MIERWLRRVLCWILGHNWQATPPETPAGIRCLACGKRWPKQ